MWLRNKLGEFFQDTKYVQLSSRLTLWYTLMLLVIMAATGLFTLAGVNFVLYHQAGQEIEISAKHVRQQPDLNRIMNPQDEDGLFLLPGVVLRIFDDGGKLVYDSNPHYFGMSHLEENTLENAPVWADSDRFKVVQFRSMVIYRHDMPMTIDSREYNMVFFKIVTAEHDSLEGIKQILLLSDLAGLLVAMLVGFALVRKALQPVRELNETAKAIQVDDLSARIEVSPAGDELTELATTFNTMLDRLERGFKAQQKFVSDASHELRTPLTVIHGYADMLERWGSKEPEVLAEAVEAIKSQSEEMQALVENLLFIARTDQKRQILKMQPLNMQEILVDVAKKMKVAIGDKHELKLLRHDEAFVMADETTLKEMLRIFLENSAKYTPEGGQITIDGWLNYQENIYKLELADDGIGIAKADQEKIFQRFYRVDSSRTKAAGQPGGTGLGLSIAKWIADSHNISIEIDSDLGRGTIFILKIPLLQDRRDKNVFSKGGRMN